MTLRLDQALFGYDRGHRLITASTHLDQESEWVLRGVTDMKFGGKTHRCFTILPLVVPQRHAFIRSWPAGGGFRPGSVWSHVLLLPSGDMDDVRDFTILDRVFRRPTPTSDVEIRALRPQYSVPLNVELADTSSWSLQVAENVLARVVTAAYGSNGPAEVVTPEPDNVDLVLLALIGQQWPSLRRHFAARTRHRQSAASVASFDVQVLERPSGVLTPTAPASEAWVGALATDLHSADARFRRFLWRFGPAGTRGRTDMAALTEVFVAAARADVEVALDLLQREYPTEAEMVRLKGALLGMEDDESVPAEWPREEAVRLLALLAMSPTSISYKGMRVGPRIESLLKEEPDKARPLIQATRWSELASDDRSAVVSALSRALDRRRLTAIASENSHLARDLLTRRRDAWTVPELWASGGVVREILVDLVGSTPRPDRDAVFLDLLLAGLRDAAEEILVTDPSIWWTVLDPARAGVVASRSSSLETAAIMLTRFGIDRVGACPITITDRSQLLVILGVSEPDDGLWRLANDRYWIDLAESPRPEDRESLPPTTGVHVISIAIGEASEQRALRLRAWDASFVALHRALENVGAPERCAKTLAKALPYGPAWDWCARLREAAARRAVADEWSENRVRAFARALGSHGTDLLARHEKASEHQSQSLLDGLRNLFRL